VDDTEVVELDEAVGVIEVELAVGSTENVETPVPFIKGAETTELNKAVLDGKAVFDPLRPELTVLDPITPVGDADTSVPVAFDVTDTSPKVPDAD